MSHSRHGTSLSNICCYAHTCLPFCPAWPTGQVLLPQLLSPDQPGDNPHPDAEQKVDDHRLTAHIGDNVSILMSQQCPSSVHLHYRKLSQRFNNFFQAKGNQDEQHEVHQAPSNYVKTQKDQSCLFLPDPDNEEEKAWREGGDRIGVRSHHLKQSIYQLCSDYPTLTTPAPTLKKAVRENKGMYLRVSQNLPTALLSFSRFSGLPIRYSSALHLPITSSELRMVER